MRRLIVLVMIFSFTTGCSMSTPKVNTKLNNIVQKSELAGLFKSDNFIIKDFSVNINKNILTYNLRYGLSDKLCAFLSRPKQRYFMYIEIPSKVSSVIEYDYTRKALLKTNFLPSNNEVKFPVVLDKDLTSTEKQLVMEDRLGYTLKVVDRDKEIVTIIEDVVMFMGNHRNIKEGTRG